MRLIHCRNAAPFTAGRLVGAAIAIVTGLVAATQAADNSKPLDVCLVSGSLEYQSNESLAEFQKYLESNYSVRCSRAFLEGKDEEHLPGLENLDHADVMLLFTRRLKLSGDQLERIKNYCLAGKPIVGVRTASHAIQSWLDLDKEVLGGNYRGHYGEGPPTDVSIVDAAKNHPVLAGVRPFRSAGSLYKNEGIAADTELLMRGAIPDHTEPIAWTRNYKGARIFYTSLGHPRDFGEESFRRLLVNALFWTAGREPAPNTNRDVEIQSDVVYGKGAGEDLKLDLATPQGLDHSVPLIVWIHGGAWRGGNKAEFERLIRESAQRGYVAASINYRLVPKHIFPAQIEDAKCAVRWLRANAERLHVDPNRIGVVGSSAGAHLAMMLGTMDSGDGLEGDGGSSGVSSRVQAVVSYAGPTNLQSAFPDASKNLVADFVGGPSASAEKAARAASPLTYASPGDPPMLLMQGTKDPLVPHDQAIQMVEALTKAGVPGRVELMIGEGHGWPKQHARVIAATFAFLDGILKP